MTKNDENADDDVVHTTIEALERNVRNAPDDLAFSVGGRSLSWRGLLEESERLAAGLVEIGLAPGDRLALVLRTSLDQIALILAAQRIRVSPVVMPPQLPLPTLAKRIARVRCRLVVAEQVPADGGGIRVATTDEIREAAGERRHHGRPGPDDVAFLQITSGTTGEPRVVVIPQRSLVAYLDGFADEVVPNDVFVGWVPLYHDMGLVVSVFAAIHTARPSYLLQPSLRNLRAWLETIDAVGGTYTSGPDFAYRIAARIVDPEGLRLDTLRVAISGGEPVKLATIRKFEKRFGLDGVVRPGYGLAEATLGVARALPGDELVTLDGQVTCGTLRRGLTVRIVDAEGNEVPAGEKGEIFVTGAQLFAGYLDDDEGTREVLQDGWLRTGDLGALDEKGRLFVYGRLRAMIKRAGSTIAPREIEEAVDGIPDVRGSAAIGVPREEGSERIVVVAEVAEGEIDSERIRSDIAERVRNAVGFFPDEVFVLGRRSIPRTDNGKVQYGELRERYRAGRLGAR